ncbi:MAG: DUF2079 domain-containing protein [Anaerolineae bacterium]
MIGSNRKRKIDGLTLGVVVTVAVLLATLSVLRYTGYNAGMLDLGNMSQAIWSATQGYPLEYTRQGGNFSRLGWHMEVIFFLIAPLYALFPDPRLLLILQAGLFAAGAWPIYRIASRYFADRNLVRVCTFIYLFYTTAQTAVLFDFHGDTLGMPLLAFALDALDQRAWRRYGVWVGLALLCKIYVALPVAALGLVLYLEGERRAGVLTTLAAVGWLAVAMLVIRPAFPSGQVEASSENVFSYLWFYFGGLDSAYLLQTLVQRLGTAFIVLLPGLFLGRYAWTWLLPALSIALPAIASVGKVAAYDYRFHHYALSVPFFVLAAIYGAVELRRRQRAAGASRVGRPWRSELLFLGALTLVFNIILVDTPLNPQFWLDRPHWGINDLKYGQQPRDRFKDRWLDEHVPPDAPLATVGLFAPHLINRRTVFMNRYPGHADLQQEAFLEHLERVDYVVNDALYDFAMPLEEGVVLGGVLHDLPAIVDVATHPDFHLLAAQDGLLLFGKDDPLKQALNYEITAEPLDSAESSEPLAVFGDAIALLAAEVTPVDVEERRFRLMYTWMPLRPLDDEPRLLAVSRLEGVEHGRYPHLPTLALHPTVEWSLGEVVHEVFEIKAPDGLASGAYRLSVGWYDSSHIEADATDERSRVGEEFVVGHIVLQE